MLLKNTNRCCFPLGNLSILGRSTVVPHDNQFTASNRPNSWKCPMRCIPRSWMLLDQGERPATVLGWITDPFDVEPIAVIHGGRDEHKVFRRPILEFKNHADRRGFHLPHCHRPNQTVIPRIRLAGDRCGLDTEPPRHAIGVGGFRAVAQIQQKFMFRSGVLNKRMHFTDCLPGNGSHHRKTDGANKYCVRETFHTDILG